MAIIAALTGGYLLSTMPEAVFPNVSFPRVFISVSCGYLPTKQMLIQVTKPIEEAAKSVQGVRKVVSSTGVGSTDIDVFFNWNVNPYRGYQLVQSRIAEVRNALPPSAQVVVKQITPSAYPIAGYALASNKISKEKLTELFYYKIRPVILGIDGVYDAEMRGGRWREYHIVVAADKLNAYHLSLTRIKQTLQRQNIVESPGLVYDHKKEYLILFLQRPKDLEGILNIKIPLQNGGFVPLGSLATVVESHAPILKYVAVDHYKNAVLFNLLRQPKANAVKVATLVDREIRGLQKTLPQGVRIVKWYDLSDFVKMSVHSIRDAIILGALITLSIIYLFLRQAKISFLTILVIPVALLMAVIIMKLLHMDFNIFSLGGMAASVAAIVDHAVVVIENIERYLRHEKDKKSAIIEASKDLMLPMTLATLTSVMVFVPLVLLSGIVGIFFRQLAITLAVAIIASQLLAITLTPVLAYLAFSAKEKARPEGKIYKRFKHSYLHLLRWGFKHSWWTIPAMLILGGSSIVMYRSLPSTLLPKWDEGSFVLDFVTPVGTSLRQTIKETQIIERILNSIPEVDHYSLRIGNSLAHPRTADNVGDFLVTLKKHRKRSVFQVMEEVRKRVNEKVPNLEEFDLSQVLEDRLGDIMGEEAPIKVQLFGAGPKALIAWGQKLCHKLRHVPSLVEVNLKTTFAGPQLVVRAKPEAEAIYGITPKQVSETIKTAFWGKVVGNVIQGEQIIKLRLITQRDLSDPIDYLTHKLLIYAPKTGEYIPISYVADVKLRRHTPEVTHENLVPMALVTARIPGNDLTGAVKDIKNVLSQMQLPPNIGVQITGFYKEQQKSFKTLTFIIVAAVLIVLIMLILQFSSLRIALAVITGTALSLFGVFLALMLTRRPLDVTSFMGMLIVLSIVLNNGILIFSQFQKGLKGKGTEAQVLFKACAVRMRPILMTMMADFWGFLPIALAIGTGTEIIQGLAIAVMGGLGFAILMSLLFMPSFYVLVKGQKAAR